MVELPCLSIDEGVKLLLQHNDLDAELDANHNEADKIVTRLGQHPLAIDQAAAYIADHPSLTRNLAGFLPLYEAKREQILKHTPEDTWEYGDERLGRNARNNAVCAFTTWEMTLSQLCHNGNGDLDPVTHFLTLSAFLASTTVDEWLFVNHAIGQRGLSDRDNSNRVDARGQRNSENDGFDASKQAQPGHCNPDALGQDNQGASDHGDLAGLDPNGCGVFEVDDSTPSWIDHFCRPQTGYSCADFASNANSPYVDVHATETYSRHKEQRGWSTEKFSDFVTRASKLSLVQHEPSISKADFTSFSLHPLIRDWLQLRQHIKRRQDFVRESIEVLARSIRQFEFKRPDPTARKVLLLHVNAAVQCDREFLGPSFRLGTIESSLVNASLFARFYVQEREYQAGIFLSQLVQQTSQSVYREHDPRTIHYARRLGWDFELSGKFPEAEEIHRKTLARLQQARGDTSLEIIRTKAYLAGILCRRQQYEEAERLQQQVIECSTTQFGPNHPLTLDYMDYLATILSFQGNHSEAEALNRVLLTMSRELWGAEHEDTLTAQLGLSWTLVEQNKLEEAEVLLRDNLEVRERILGADHPDTGHTRSALAHVLTQLGRLQEAEVLFGDDSEVLERIEGADHPYTLAARSSLALALSQSGRLQEAEAILRDVICISERRWTASRTETLRSRSALVENLILQDRQEEAVAIFRDILHLQQESFGADNIELLDTMHALAHALWNTAKLDEAHRYIQLALTGRERALGSNHVATIWSRNAAADFCHKIGCRYMDEGRFDDARAQLEDAVNQYARLPRNEKVVEHVCGCLYQKDYAYVCVKLAYQLLNDSQFVQARAMLEKAFRLCEDLPSMTIGVSQHAKKNTHTHANNWRTIWRSNVGS